MPERCASIRRIVGEPSAIPSRCCSSRSSRSSAPASRSCMIAVAVNVFVIEPMRYCVSGRRLAALVVVRAADGVRPDELALAHDGGGDRRQPVGLPLLQEPVERLRRGQGLRAPAGRARRARVDVVVGDVEMRHGAQCARLRRRQQHTRAPRACSIASSSSSPSAPTSTCTKFVSTSSRSTGSPAAAQPSASRARARVVVGEPLDVVVERVEARGGDDPGLAHRAAEAVLLDARA